MPQEMKKPPKAIWDEMKVRIRSAELAGTPLGYRKIQEEVNRLSDGKYESLAGLEKAAGVHIDQSLLVSDDQSNKRPAQGGPKQQAALVEQWQAEGVPADTLNRRVKAMDNPHSTADELQEQIRHEARARLRSLINEEPLGAADLSPAQNVALTGYGMSFGQSPKLAGGMAAAGNLLSDPRGAYRQAHDTNQQYMDAAFAQNPEAARNQTRFGGAVATAATLGKIAGPRPPVAGPRGFPGTLKFGAEGAAFGEGGLSGGGASLRWGGLAPLTAADLTANRLPQQVPPGTAQLPPPYEPPTGLLKVPGTARDATKAEPQAFVPETPQQAVVAKAFDVEDRLAELESKIRQEVSGGREVNMMSPGRNAVGSTVPGVGVVAGGTEVLRGIADVSPGPVGDAAAVGQVAEDIGAGEVGVGTLLSALSLIPALPNLRKLSQARKIKYIEEHAPDLLKSLNLDAGASSKDINKALETARNSHIAKAKEAGEELVGEGIQKQGPRPREARRETVTAELLRKKMPGIEFSERRAQRLDRIRRESPELFEAVLEDRTTIAAAEREIIERLGGEAGYVTRASKKISLRIRQAEEAMNELERAGLISDENFDLYVAQLAKLKKEMAGLTDRVEESIPEAINLLKKLND